MPASTVSSWYEEGWEWGSGVAGFRGEGLLCREGQQSVLLLGCIP